MMQRNIQIEKILAKQNATQAFLHKWAPKIKIIQAHLQKKNGTIAEILNNTYQRAVIGVNFNSFPSKNYDILFHNDHFRVVKL